MRSQEEILERIKERDADDLLGFEWFEYVYALDLKHAITFLEHPNQDWKPKTPDEIKTRMKDYMPFAIKKAETERGISANRSIMHYIAWLWLVEEDDLLAKVDHEYETNYHSFGLPILKMIDDHFGWGNELKGVFP
jgi:hypothetical protein